MNLRTVVMIGALLAGAGCGGAETANDSAQAPVDSGLTMNTPLTDNVDTSKTAAMNRDSAGAGRADTTRGNTRRP